MILFHLRHELHLELVGLRVEHPLRDSVHNRQVNRGTPAFPDGFLTSLLVFSLHYVFDARFVMMVLIVLNRGDAAGSLCSGIREVRKDLRHGIDFLGLQRLVSMVAKPALYSLETDVK